VIQCGTMHAVRRGAEARALSGALRTVRHAPPWGFLAVGSGLVAIKLLTTVALFGPSPNRSSVTSNRAQEEGRGEKSRPEPSNIPKRQFCL
jgi:hypothetical protein